MAEPSDKLRQTAEQGRQFYTAQQQLEQIFDILERSYKDQSALTTFDELDVREECYRSLQTLERMRGIFTKIIGDGLTAANEIETAAKVATGLQKEFH